MIWTMDDIRGAAAVACSRIRVSPGTAYEVDMNDVAQSAIGLAIAENPEIDWPDAVAAAARDVWDAVTDGRERHGHNSRGDEKPRYIAFWLDWTRPHNSVGYKAVEARMTLLSLLDLLPERHWSTLLALANATSMTQAAEVVGVKRHTFACRVQAARKAALAIWFDWEQPPALQRLPINQLGRERTCKQGHVIAGDNVETNWQNRKRIERCKTCRREQRRAYKERVA